MIFPNNTRKIIFRRDFFERTIFSGHLEKENMVFCAVKINWYSQFGQETFLTWFSLFTKFGVPEFLDPVRLTLHSGSWTLIAGLLTLESKLETLDAGTWTLNSGHFYFLKERKF